MIALLGKTAAVEVNATLTLPGAGKKINLSLVFHVLALYFSSARTRVQTHCIRLCRREMLS